MKRVILLIISIMVLFGMLLGQDVKAYRKEYNPKTIAANYTEEANIKRILQGYFENRWNEEKEGRIIENKYIMPDSLQMSYANLKSKLNHKWCKEIKEGIEWFNVDVDINSINTVDDLLEVDVNNKSTFLYKGEEKTSSLNEHHIVYLNNKNGNMLVERDIYNDLLSDDYDIATVKDYCSTKEVFEEYINQKIKEIISNLETADDDIEKYKEDMQIYIEEKKPKHLCSSYDGSEAASWARSHVDDSEEFDGQDCTNFVSRALYAGGLPTDGTWYYHSNAWIRVIELRSWLLEKGYAYEVNGVAYGKKGDVIQFYNKSKCQWSHSVIITYVNDRYGNIYVTAHTNKADNVSIRNYYPSSRYSNARTLRLS